MIKQTLRKAARRMAAWPIVGRFVRIGVAVIRLPEFNASHLDLSHRQDVFEKALSELNHRQLVLDNDKANLVRSVPVTLRKITRDLIEIRAQLDSLSTCVDQRLDQTRGRLDIAGDSVDYLLGRVEFVRRELMFEMRYGASSPSSGREQLKADTEILDEEKVASARREGLRLNLGCGHVPLDGYLNVDRRALPGVDIVAEVDVLPFGQDEVDEIFSAHLLEHFPQEQLRRDLLPYWIGLLKHGGVLRSVVPDAETMIKEYAGGSYPYAALREVTFGAQDYDGDFHYNMFVPGQVEDLLKDAGLADIEWLSRGRRNGDCFEMEFKAVKR